MGAAFGGECHAGWCADDDKAGILITGIVQCIEATRDERIVDRADGNEAFAEQGMRKSRRTEQEEQVHFGDTEFDMLSRRRELPFLGRGDLLVAERVAADLAREQAAPVHPGAEIGRHSDIGRGCDDAVGQFGFRLGERVENLAETGLGRLNVVVEEDRAGAGDSRGGEAAGPGSKEGDFAQESVQGVGVFDTCHRGPFVAFGDPHLALKVSHLGLVHQAGMIVLVPGERCAPALDRVGEEDGGRVVGS